MSHLKEMPATLLRQPGEELDRERSRAHAQHRREEESGAHVEPLDENWVSVGFVVVGILQKM